MTRRLFITDIFGKTPEFETLTSAVGGETEIVDPYSGKYVDFLNESEAYAYFMDNVGIDRYRGILDEKLESISVSTELIGFSVGATILWRQSETLPPKLITRAVCFYGSRIRHFLNVRPAIAVELILPYFESSCNVDELARHISTIANVTIHKTGFLHGFMNRRSENFHSVGYQKHIKWLRTGTTSKKKT